jgi:hypothetical protein
MSDVHHRDTLPVNGNEKMSFNMLIEHYVNGKQLSRDQEWFIETSLSGLSVREVARGLLVGFKSEGLEKKIDPSIEIKFGEEK